MKPGRSGGETRVQELPAYFGSVALSVGDEHPPAVYAAIDTYLAGHPGGHERLIPVLHRAQEVFGYLPFEVQEYIADKLGLTPIQVYEVVSFYHFFTTTPRGRYQLKVCRGTACFVRHADRLLETIDDVIGLKVGEVTADRIFSLEQVRCIGACGLAPAMIVNSEVYGNLTATDVRKLVRRLRAAARKEAGAAEVAHE